MASGNPFELLVDDDSEDLSQLISANLKKIETKITTASSDKAPQSQVKLPPKPVVPTQAGRGARDGGRGGGRGNWHARGGGTHGEYGNNGSSNGRGGRGPSRGAHRGSFTNGYGNHAQSPRQSARHNGGGGSGNWESQTDEPAKSGSGNWQSQTAEPAKNSSGNWETQTAEPAKSGAGNWEIQTVEPAKSGSGNWETQTDEPAKVTGEVVGEGEKNLKKPASVKNDWKNGQRKNGYPLTEEEIAKRQAEREEDAKKMTLAQYEKLLEEKKKGLPSGQTEERKIKDKDFETMKKVSNKNTKEVVFVKLASDKEKKKPEKEEKAKKSVMSIDEFLKPAEGERRYNSGGRGRGRGNGRDNAANDEKSSPPRPAYVEDPSQFPTLGGK